MGHSTPNGAKFLRLGHDPSQNLKKKAKLLQYIRYDNPENFSLISCMGLVKFLFKVSNVTLKTPKLGFKVNLYDFWSFIFLKVLILEGQYFRGWNLVFQPKVSILKQYVNP